MLPFVRPITKKLSSASFSASKSKSSDCGDGDRSNDLIRCVFDFLMTYLIEPSLNKSQSKWGGVIEVSIIVVI
jgi:hypothetical protein